MSRSGRRPGVLAAVRALTDLAIPIGCAACGREGEVVCSSCEADLPACLWPTGPLAVRPRPVPAGLPRVHSAGRYAGSLATLVAAYKDDGRRDCEALLGRLLARSLDASLASCPELVALLRRRDGPVLVVPVPSAASARRRRGDAPLLALAGRAVAGYEPAELCLADALRTRRRVADQAGLGARDRAVNLEHAMAVRPRWESAVAGAACVVVDDVLTTGSTLAEAAGALRSAGATTLAGATICATERRGGSATVLPSHGPGRPRRGPPEAGRTA